MKIVRFRAAGKIRYGVLEGAQIVEYAGTPYGTFKKARKRYPLRQSVLLMPVAPSKVVAVGLNYRDHAEEMSAVVETERHHLGRDEQSDQSPLSQSGQAAVRGCH